MQVCSSRAVVFNGGAIVIAAICILVATRKEARGAFKWLLWLVAITLLLMQAGCWLLGRNVGQTLSGPAPRYNAV